MDTEAQDTKDQASLGHAVGLSKRTVNWIILGVNPPVLDKSSKIVRVRKKRRKMAKDSRKSNRKK